MISSNTFAGHISQACGACKTCKDQGRGVVNRADLLVPPGGQRRLGGAAAGELVSHPVAGGLPGGGAPELDVARRGVPFGPTNMFFVWTKEVP